MSLSSCRHASLTQKFDLYQTVLYWAQEYYCNYCAVGHNKLFDLILLWIIPNGYVHEKL